MFAPLDSKDYTQYFGQIRAARPQVVYTSVAGNDTVRLLTQMQDFASQNMTIVGASGTVTSQNISAIGKAAEGFVTASATRRRSTRPRTRSSSPPSRTPTRTTPTSTAPIPYGLIYAYKAAVEKAGSTETDKVREALRGLGGRRRKERRPSAPATIRPCSRCMSSRSERQFDIVGTVGVEEAIGPDACTRFDGNGAALAYARRLSWDFR